MGRGTDRGCSDGNRWACFGHRTTGRWISIVDNGIGRANHACDDHAHGFSDSASTGLIGPNGSIQLFAGGPLIEAVRAWIPLVVIHWMGFTFGHGEDGAGARRMPLVGWTRNHGCPMTHGRIPLDSSWTSRC